MKQREILFRGQDLITSEWKYGFFYQTEHSISYIQSKKPGYPFEHGVVKEKTVTQYTGLKDINGKKIFEGDICKISAEEPYPDVGFATDYDWSQIGSIKMIDCAWCVLAKSKDSIFLYDVINRDIDINIKILGNIFENHELLEK